MQLYTNDATNNTPCQCPRHRFELTGRMDAAVDTLRGAHKDSDYWIDPDWHQPGEFDILPDDPNGETLEDGLDRNFDRWFATLTQEQVIAWEREQDELRSRWE